MGSLFPLPSLSDCVQFARNSFRANLPGSNAWLWPNNIGPSAKVIGGAQWEVYQRLDWVARQAFVLFAEGQYLEDHAAQYGLSRRQAAPSGGNVVVATDDAIAIAIGAQLQRGDGVIVSATIAGAASAAGSLTIPVVANVPAAAGNSQPGTPLTFLSGVTGPGASTATAVVDQRGLTGGLDLEPDGPPRSSSLATLRGRVLWRLRNPLQGGAPSDYVGWASAVPGVTRVFVERQAAGPGTVRIFPIFDSIFVGGVADAAHIELVADSIASVAPVDARIVVSAPVAQPIPVTVEGLNPSTAAVRQAIQAELLDAFQRLGRVAGNDPGSAGVLAAMPFLAGPFSFAAIWCAQAVADASGAYRGIMVSPTSDTTIPVGAIPVLGVLNFE